MQGRVERPILDRNEFGFGGEMCQVLLRKTVTLQVKIIDFPKVFNVKFEIDSYDNSPTLCSRDIDSWKSDDQFFFGMRKVFLY